MAPSNNLALTMLAPRDTLQPTQEDNTRLGDIVEGWAQGFNVGAIVVLILILLCNYRKGVLLHKLILLELLLAIWHGFFIFFRKDPIVFGWILSGTAVPLYLSYSLHNLIAWLKIRPFLPKWGSWMFIGSLALVQPYWAVETYANFAYFNNLGNEMFKTTRFLEPLMRDPWWVFTTLKLVVVLKRNYEYTLSGLIATSPRFGIMLFCMMMSIIFLIVDVVATAVVSTQSGINPFWRLALVFKCASDTIFLDDFKSVLDQIAESIFRRIRYGTHSQTNGRNKSTTRTAHHETGAHGTSVSITGGGGGHRMENLQRKGSNVTKKSGLAWPTAHLSRKRSFDSGENRLVGDVSSNDSHHGMGGGGGGIVAETTITSIVSDGKQDMGDDIESAFPVEPRMAKTTVSSPNGTYKGFHFGK